MVYELYPAAHGAILRGELEQTYASGPTVSAADTLRCPLDATFDAHKRSWIDRSTQAAFVTGVRSSPGQAVGEYSIEVVLDHATIPAAPDTTTEGAMTGVPSADIFFRAGGWQVASSASADYAGLKPDNVTLLGSNNDRILTYTYKPRSTGANFTSGRFQYTEVSESGEGYLHDLTGARHGWTLRMNGGDHWTLACDGNSLATKPSKVSPTITSAFADNDAVVGVGGNYSVCKMVATADTFGKTSETQDAADLTAFVYNMELASNLEIQPIVAPNGTLGVAQCRYVAGRPSLSLTMDQVTWSDDWDLYTFADQGRAIRITNAIPQPGTAPTSFVVFRGVFQITDISRGSENGYKNVSLTLDYLYPDSAGDGGGLAPDAGITFKYVTIMA